METARGSIHQIHTSRGGVPKLPIAEARVTSLGIEGDFQRDAENHGGAERALCLYSLEEIARLRAEGHPISAGAAGENVTLEGIDLAALKPGVRLRLGDAVEIAITSYVVPCKNIAGCFADGDFTRISEKLHPGESRRYARVLRGGVIRGGDPVVLVGEGE